MPEGRISNPDREASRNSMCDHEVSNLSSKVDGFAGLLRGTGRVVFLRVSGFGGISRQLERNILQLRELRSNALAQMNEIPLNRERT
jgi:hypothetical protein